MYDAVVVGARCAGAATAMLLGRQGHTVLLVDKTAVGSDIPHGHFIHRGGPQWLHKWGVLDQAVETGCPLVSKMVMTVNGSPPLHGENLMMDGVPFGFAPRRSALDKVLVDNARAAGVEFRDRFVVEKFLREGERITGIKGRDLHTGQVVTEMAQITIGADGRHSRLAQAVQAPMYEQHPTVSCYYFSYWRGISTEALELHVGNDFVIFVFPTNNNLVAVFVAWSIERLHAVRSDIETHFMATLAQIPQLAERVRAGQRADRFYGMSDLPNFFRKPYGPGWALVGDAGHHKDPYMALGITDAFRDADLVATAVHKGLTGAQEMAEALADFERQRNETSMPFYHENLARAQFTPPPPEMGQIWQALVVNGNQQDTNSFLAVNLGLQPHETFFNPDNTGRIMQRAAQQTASPTHA